MKYFLSAVFIICFVGFAHAQTSNKAYTIKAFNSIKHQNYSTVIGENKYSLDQWSFISLSASISKYRANGDYHELELQELRFGSDDDIETHMRAVVGGSYRNLFSSALRYGYNFALNSSEKKTQFFLGAAMTAYYMRNRTIPVTSNSFPTSYTDWGGRFAIIPSINYKLNENWFIDVNIPFHLAQININHSMVENPSFSAEQRKSNTISSDQFPYYYEFRVGVGRRL